MQLIPKLDTNLKNCTHQSLQNDYNSPAQSVACRTIELSVQ